MQPDVDHNKIIKQTVNAVLKPNGLFQKGSARIWIDDNGWYLTVVEFQPSAWSAGSYLNVAIHYLWDDKDYLSFDYCCNERSIFIHRVGDFVEFDGDAAKFSSDIQGLAETAMRKVNEYRCFRDLDYARTAILQSEAHRVVDTLYPRLMICGLCRDPHVADHFEELLRVLRSTDMEWTRKYYVELTENIAPIIDDPQKLYSYIRAKIMRRREFWLSKSSMKKLNRQAVFLD